MTTTATTTLIDVREIPPRERHSTIFAAFRRLELGEALDIVNDHDPRPLRAQFESQTPGGFSWTYLQSGPEVWQVRIQKLVQAQAAGGCCGHCGGGA